MDEVIDFLSSWDSSHSAYERARFFTAVGLAGFCIGFILFTGLHDFRGWVTSGIGILVFNGAYLFRCPKCKKPLLTTVRNRPNSGIFYFRYAKRLWPETVCSQCGTDLTVTYKK